MNMNSKFNETTTTTDEYFKILEQESLKPEDLTKKASYESYISRCKQYEDLISPAAQSILTEYNTKIMSLSNKKNSTTLENDVLNEFHQSFNNSLEQEGPVLKLAKSGYIDATIVLVIILNVGFIVALALLGK